MSNPLPQKNTLGVHPKQVALDVEAKLLDPDALLRATLSHTWWVAGKLDEHGREHIGVLSTDKGKILELFSDEEALSTFEERSGEARPERLIQISGWSLFSTLEEGSVQRINFDQFSKHRYSYEGSQLELLKGWAATVSVELALYQPDSVVNPFAMLRRHPTWTMLARRSEGELELVMAPDEAGRSLAAVFSAADTADAFVSQVGLESFGEGVEVMSLNGEDLFSTLRQMPIEGIVFNPWTHMPAQAISAAAIPVILESR